MNDPKIPGGYYIKARAIQKSNIMRQPPHVREIWDYLLMNANHSDRKYGGYSIKRGQLFRTYKQIREDLSWNVGWRKETYNENQTKKAMKFLREALMIDTTKEPGGVLITICNYEFYQDPRNYERTSERTSERTIDEPSTNQPAPYNKNGNNKIMGKDNIADSVPESETLTEVDGAYNKYNIDNDNSIAGIKGHVACLEDGEINQGMENPKLSNARAPGNFAGKKIISTDDTDGLGNGAGEKDGTPNRAVAKPFTLSEVRQMRLSWWSEEEWEDLIDLRRKKKAAQTKRAYNQLIKEFEKAKERGYTADEIMNAMNSGKGWSGFKLEWMKETPRIYRLKQEKPQQNMVECQFCQGFTDCTMKGQGKLCCPLYTPKLTIHQGIKEAVG